MAHAARRTPARLSIETGDPFTCDPLNSLPLLLTSRGLHARRHPLYLPLCGRKQQVSGVAAIDSQPVPGELFKSGSGPTVAYPVPLRSRVTGYSEVELADLAVPNPGAPQNPFQANLTIGVYNRPMF